MNAGCLPVGKPRLLCVWVCALACATIGICMGIPRACPRPVISTKQSSGACAGESACWSHAAMASDLSAGRSGGAPPALSLPTSKVRVPLVIGFTKYLCECSGTAAADW
jgi:hypothetical protein